MLALKASFLTIVISSIVVVMVATLKPDGSNALNDFSLVCQTKSIAGNVPILKFRSLKTGLHVILVQLEGPTVQGYFTLATEAQDDEGLPHTLEHLVFMGSEDYPYKGVLDLLANRCLAEGTNAWTATDHTAYTVKTAGSEGFLEFLPIYLEHLLYPTLTDAAYTTEVYHISAQGKDSGVVYSEMQAVENTGSELTYNNLMRLLYPEPSGYRYETGGIMADLRNNLTNEKVRGYHKAMYRPENLHVIIAGQVEPQEVFQTLKKLEEKIASNARQDPFVKPWSTPVPPFSKAEDLEIVYPSDTEDTGIVRVGWRGPSIKDNITEFQSVEVLMKYLTEVSVSPLPKVFVEVKDPLASKVYTYTIEYSTSAIVVDFRGVPKGKINSVKPLLMDTLKKMGDNTIPFDIDVMRNTINNIILNEESKLETNPHHTLSDYIILDVLYGNECQNLDKVINKKLWYEHLLTESQSYWLNLLKKYMVNAPPATVTGVPSIAEAKRLQEEEKTRVEERKTKLGEAGLKELAKIVAESKAINEIEPPQAMLESVPVPSAANINFHTLNTYTNILNHSSGPIPKSDPALLDLNLVPVKMQLNDVKSNFVQLVAVLDTSSLSGEERLYLPLLMELLLESPIQKGVKEIPYEVVIADLNKDTTSAQHINGLTLTSSMFTFGHYSNYVGINIKVERNNYEKGVEWLSDILFGVVFSKERASVKASKLLNSVGDHKRSGRTLIDYLNHDIIFKSESNRNKASVLRQEKFLTTLIADMKINPSQVLQKLNKVYRSITNLDNITIVMATNLEKLAQLKNATAPWTNFTRNGGKSENFSLNIVSEYEDRTPLSEYHPITGHIAGIGSVETTFLRQSTPAITNYSDPDLPALLTVITYFTQLEGPMWKEIRGKGYAYSYSISMDTYKGMLTLLLVKAVQPEEAYKAAADIINSHLNGTRKWDRLLFESARSSLVYQVVKREVDVSDVVQQALYAYFRKVKPDYNKSFLRDIDNVKLEDLDKIAHKYLPPLMNPKSSHTVVVCPSSKATGIKTELEKMGHVMELINSLENSKFSEILN